MNRWKFILRQHWEMVLVLTVLTICCAAAWFQVRALTNHLDKFEQNAERQSVAREHQRSLESIKRIQQLPSK